MAVARPPRRGSQLRGVCQRIIAMSKIEMRHAEADDGAEWKHAWQVVAQLAEARGAMRQINAELPATPAAPLAPDSTAAANRPVPDQLTRAIAEIERAAKALRRAEPTLEPGRPMTETSVEVRGTRSVWLLVGVIWLAALVVVSCGVATVALVLG